MDFLKVLDQTVREIKREVNLKVLKVPEIEQKVLDATSDEPWGPHGSDLADIARATKRFGECAMILNVLWQRLRDTDANWRHVYKALSVIEYLLANGTERVVDDIIDNSSQIAKFTRFEYVEPNGKDVGLNVRKKAETVLAILDDREKLQLVRQKAATTRDKYFGLSSTGISYKSSAASFGSGSYSSGNRHGSTGSSTEAISFRDSYRGKEWSNGSEETVSGYSTSRQISKENTNGATGYKSTNEGGHGRTQDSSTSHSKPLSNLSTTSGGSSSQKVDKDDDDEFNPRGSSSSAGTVNASSNLVDLFGPSLMDDFVDTTTMPNVGTSPAQEVDLFANTAFQSCTPLQTATGSHTQDNIDLFADRSSFAGFITSDTEFSMRSSPSKSSVHNVSSAHPSTSSFDPFQPLFATSFPSDTEFSVHNTPRKSLQEKNSIHQHSNAADFSPLAAIPQSNLYGSDSFGEFSSKTRPGHTEPRLNPPGGVKNSEHIPLEELNFGDFTSYTESPTASAIKPTSKLPTKLDQASPKPDVKIGAFQVKSGIWADSLSRGLIDLNITVPKKVDLSDAGVVGQLSDGSEEKGLPAPWYMGSTMGIRSGRQGRSDFPSSAGTTGASGNIHQQQFGSFK